MAGSGRNYLAILIFLGIKKGVDLELLRIPRNSHKFSLVFLQFPIIPISSKDSFLQTWNYWEFLGIPKNSHWCFNPFPSIPRYFKVFYLCSFACLGINWNS